ncbi:MAG: glycine oxidase ThiO [Actinomycetota bacterium]|nr:glycine oxidase ThiO [Actinomycetota bacterium]
MSAPCRADVAVVGGGIIGLACAWQSARRGLKVTVLDPAPGMGASWAAAGMLAPLSEATPKESALLPLATDSLRRWPAFAADLEADAGAEVGLRQEGTLAVAFDDDDRRHLADILDRSRSFGLSSEWLTSRACRRLEPALHPSVRGGFEVPTDLQVDNRAVVMALVAVVQARTSLRREAVAKLDPGDNGRAHRLVTASGEVVEANQVVLATGATGSPIVGIPDACRSPVRPVRGDIARLKGDPDTPILNRVTRAHVEGRLVYLVPRRNGEVVVGATSEEGGYRTESRAGAVHDLLHDALAVVPALSELELAEVMGRLRPATPDNAPIIGHSALDRLIVATGHYRNGFLLGPITADAVVAALVGEPGPSSATPFTPARFG